MEVDNQYKIISHHPIEIFQYRMVVMNLMIAVGGVEVDFYY